MRVLLINPPIINTLPNKEFMFPPALLYLAGTVKKYGIEVKILDLNVFKPWLFENDSFLEGLVLKYIASYNPDLVGFGCIFSGVFPFIVNLSEKIHKAFKAIPMVVGGIHATVFPKEILQNTSIDYVIIGEGEEQFCALTKAIDKDDYSTLSKVDGIAYRKGKEIIVNPKTRFINRLDEFLPAYDVIDFKEYYHPTEHWHNPKRLNFKMSVPVLSSRSCPTRCNFCSMFLVMGPSVRCRSAENMVNEIEMLYSKYGQNHFTFVDDNMNINKQHIISLCKEIIRRKLNIQFEVSNGLSVASLSKEIIDLMATAGWVRGGIGIESGSDFLRNKVIGKNLSRKKIMEVVQSIKAHKNIYLKAWFIIGFPEETPQTLFDTYNMIRDLQIDEADVINLMPYPGTRVFEQCVRDNLLIDKIKLGDLWKTTGFQMHNNERFYIKPYKMEISELMDFREKFDRLLEKINSHGRNPATGKI
jgi:magnesium-protoporphyrin IX monomethyl ester (oxidative) cyclase